MTSLLDIHQEVVSRGVHQADDSSDAEAARALAAHRRALKQAKRNQSAHRVIMIFCCCVNECRYNKV